LSDTSRKSGRRIKSVENCRLLRSLSLWISVVSLFVLVGGRAARAADVPNAPGTSVEVGPQLAIADLDGDLLPDSASIQAGQSAGSMGTYWIHVHVAAGPRSFPVVAPAFGLVIKARYIDRRDAADLVLATAWSRRPVAVFRNDGHGNFSRADPASPGSLNDSQTSLDSSRDLATLTAGAPPQSRAGICAGENDLVGNRSPAGLIPHSSPGFPASPFSVSHSGRAPPCAVPDL
jgi:hypothetical protein